MGELARGEQGALGGERSIEDVPANPDSVVCHVDGYGNVKTSIRASEFDPGSDEVVVDLSGRSRSVTVNDGVFDVPEGTIAIAPGSAGGDDPYVELFFRGDSAAAAFDEPRPGDELTIR